MRCLSSIPEYHHHERYPSELLASSLATADSVKVHPSTFNAQSSEIEDPALQGRIRSIQAVSPLHETLQHTSEAKDGVKHVKFAANAGKRCDSDRDDVALFSPLYTHATPPPGYFNARKAMRVLEDHLCLEIVRDWSKPLSFYSLARLQFGTESNDSFFKVMAKYNLSPSHLTLLRRLKKTLPTTPELNWDTLCINMIRPYKTNGSGELRRVVDLLQVARKVTSANTHRHTGLKSPLRIDDDNDTVFNSHSTTSHC